jgi:hypothetical protein
MHLDQEQVQRLMHGEPVADPHSVRQHLASCTECRERLDAAGRDEAEVFALLRQLDHRPPATDAAAVASQARPIRPAWGQWAAGILLLAGAAGVAYAVPGSPLRDWVRSVAAWIGGSERPPAPAPGQTPGPALAGIAAVPGPEFVITFKSPESGGHARVSLSDGAEVSVRGPLGAASYTSDANRLVIDNQGSGATFEIEIPRTAARVEIRVAGKRIFLKDRARVVTNAAEEIGGHYLLPLSP